MLNEEGGLHPTPQMMAAHEPAVRLCSVGIPYALEATSSEKDGANNVGDGPNNGLADYHATMIMEGIM
jgi:hypothetical protein